MKRILALVVLVGFVSGYAFAQTSEVKSVNIVGYSKVSIPPGGQIQLVGLNFTSISTNGYLTLREVFGTNQLAQHATAQLRCDRIFLYDPYKSGGAGYVGVLQKPDGKFYTIVGNNETNINLYSGDSFWIQSANSATLTNNITIMGSVPLNTGIEAAYPNGLSLFCNPFSSDYNINSTNFNWKANGARSGTSTLNSDNIFIWNGSGYVGYFLRTSTSNWHENVGGVLASNGVIRVGAGAWYLSRGAGFTNNWTKPYNL